MNQCVFFFLFLFSFEEHKFRSKDDDERCNGWKESQHSQLVWIGEKKYQMNSFDSHFASLKLGIDVLNDLLFLSMSPKECVQYATHTYILGFFSDGTMEN